MLSKVASVILISGIFLLKDEPLFDYEKIIF